MCQLLVEFEWSLRHSRNLKIFPRFIEICESHTKIVLLTQPNNTTWWIKKRLLLERFLRNKYSQKVCYMPHFWRETLIYQERAQYSLVQLQLWTLAFDCNYSKFTIQYHWEPKKWRSLETLQHQSSRNASVLFIRGYKFAHSFRLASLEILSSTNNTSYLSYLE